MIERYCDICGTRMPDNTVTQPVVRLERLKVRILRAVDGVWNGGDACIPCLQKVVATGEFQTLDRGPTAMRRMMARLRGPQLTPGERVTTVLDQPTARVWSPVTVRRAGYVDAVDEALVVVECLGLEVASPMDAGDLVRFVYAQGWQAAEKRMAAPDKADVIDQALRDPSAVLEQRPGESLHGWQVRAVQAAVAYGVPNKGTV